MSKTDDNAINLLQAEIAKRIVTPHNSRVNFGQRLKRGFDRPRSLADIRAWVIPFIEAEIQERAWEKVLATVQDMDGIHVIKAALEKLVEDFRVSIRDLLMTKSTDLVLNAFSRLQAETLMRFVEDLNSIYHRFIKLPVFSA